jgi:hypothetical protein
MKDLFLNLYLRAITRAGKYPYEVFLVAMFLLATCVAPARADFDFRTQGTRTQTYLVLREASAPIAPSAPNQAVIYMDPTCHCVRMSEHGSAFFPWGSDTGATISVTAASVSASPFGTIGANTVQGQLQEIHAEIAASAGVDSFEGRTGAVTFASGDATAAEITSSSTGDVAATNVQSAIAELASEKVGISTAQTVTGAKTFSTTLTVQPSIAPAANSIMLRANASNGIPNFTVDAEGDLVAKTVTVDGGALAPVTSPSFVGNPTAPTPAATDNDTSIATTAFVQSETLNSTEADALFLTPAEGDTLFVTPAEQTTALAPYAPLASPTLTGNPLAPTASTSDNDTSIATTAFVQAQKASPVFTGNPTAPTPAASDNDTSVATTAFVQSETLNQTEGDARYAETATGNAFVGNQTVSGTVSLTANSAGVPVLGITQSSATGGGLHIKPGADSVYAFLINNAANDTNRHAFYGNGEVMLSNGGKTAIGTSFHGFTGPPTRLQVGSVNDSIPVGTVGATLFLREDWGASNNSVRGQFALTRREASAAWMGTYWRWNYAVDSSFTDGSLAAIDIGSDASSVGQIFLRTQGVDRLKASSAGVAVMTGAGAGTAGLTVQSTSQVTHVVPHLGSGQFNGLTQAGDMGIIAQGSGIDTGTIMIGPYSATSKGMRIDATGKVTFPQVPQFSAGYTSFARTTADGVWTSVAYNAANFTANGATWTVDAGDQIDYAYEISGKTMTVRWRIFTTDVSVAANQLRIAIPDGRTAAATSDGPFWYSNAAGAYSVGLVQVSASGTYLELYRDPALTLWSATAADNTTLRGTFRFQIN